MPCSAIASNFACPFRHSAGTPFHMGTAPSNLPTTVEVTDTKSIDHGDYATNYAMVERENGGPEPSCIGRNFG